MRTKTLNQIREQYNRIYAATTSPERTEQIYSTFSRYERNIMRHLVPCNPYIYPEWGKASKEQMARAEVLPVPASIYAKQV